MKCSKIPERQSNGFCLQAMEIGQMTDKNSNNLTRDSNNLINVCSFHSNSEESKIYYYIWIASALHNSASQRLPQAVVFCLKPITGLKFPQSLAHCINHSFYNFIFLTLLR